nr:hypothetical protein [Tanacetum cinerariifolium]
MKSDKFIKSSVENLVPNPSESEGENGCDVHACFTTFSNVLFDADYEFDSSDDQSLYDEDVPEKIFSNPLFEKEIIPIKINQHHDNAESTHDSSLIISSKIDSLLYEFADELTLLKSIPPRIDETDYDDDSERDILIREELFENYSLSLPVIESYHFDIPSFSRPPAKPPDGNTRILNIKMMGDNSEQKNIPIQDVPLYHFYPLDQFKYGGNWVKLSDLKQALRGRHPMLSSILENLKTLAKGFYPSSLHFLSFILGIILLHLAGSQPMLKSSYKAEDGVIISIPPLVGGVADVVVEIKGT